MVFSQVQQFSLVFIAWFPLYYHFYIPIPGFCSSASYFSPSTYLPAALSFHLHDKFDNLYSYLQFQTPSTFLNYLRPAHRLSSIGPACPKVTLMGCLLITDYYLYSKDPNTERQAVCVCVRTRSSTLKVSVMQRAYVLSRWTKVRNIRQCQCQIEVSRVSHTHTHTHTAKCAGSATNFGHSPAAML